MKNNITLKARWSKKQKDIIYSFPRKCDGAYLNRIFTQKNENDFINNPPLVLPTSLYEELERRGYDLTTLKFEVRLYEI